MVVQAEASEVLVTDVCAISVDVDVLGALCTLGGALGVAEEGLVVNVDVLGALGTLEGTLGALEDILGRVELGAEKEVGLLGVGRRTVGV